jgi:hypothetical protein
LRRSGRSTRGDESTEDVVEDGESEWVKGYRFDDLVDCDSSETGECGEVRKESKLRMVSRTRSAKFELVPTTLTSETSAPRANCRTPELCKSGKEQSQYSASRCESEKKRLTFGPLRLSDVKARALSRRLHRIILE